MNGTRDELPPGWSVVPLADLVGSHGVLTDGDWVESKDQDPEGGVRLIQLADVGDGMFRDRSARFLTEAKAASLRCTFLHKGDVLIARMPDPLGRACLFPGSKMPCVTVVDVCILRPGHADAEPGYLTYFINSPQFRTAVAALQRGSTRKRISRKNLSSLEIRVPPASEQHRIVDALASYISRLDSAARTLARARQNLERHRASVLHAAVQGRLVPTEAELARSEGRHYEPASALIDRILTERRRRWEKTEHSKMAARGKLPKNDQWKRNYQEPAAPNTTGRPDLPEGWCWVRLDQLLAAELSNGRSVKTSANGFPVLRLTAIRGDVVDVREHKLGAWSQKDAQPYLISQGDILVSRGNGSKHLVGRGGLVPTQPRPVAYPDTLIRIRLCSGIDPRYFTAVWNSRTVRDQIESRAKTTAGIYKINQADLASCLIPLPPLYEQQRIQREVARVISSGEAVRMAIAKSETRLNRLRQAVLRAAYEGDLSDQDPSDEPAAALVARVRATRATSGTKATAPAPRRTTEGPANRGRSAAAASAGVLLRADSVPKRRTARATPQSIRAPGIQTRPAPQVMTAFRKAASEKGHERDDLIRAVAADLGYQRLGATIRDVLSQHLRAAVRRGIVERSDGLYRLARISIEDYDTNALVAVLQAVMRRGVEYESAEVVRSAAEHLGFRRVTQRVHDAVDKALNSATRAGTVKRARDTVWRP